MFILEKRDGYYFAKVSDKLSHKDYIEDLIPKIESALADQTENKFIMDITEFEGWSEIRAAYDDFKTGMKHRKDFDKIAVIGNKKWEEFIIKTFGFFIKAKVKFFYTENNDLAENWITK